MNLSWKRRLWLLSLFILLDYFATLLLISTPNQEANTFARAFMETFGVTTGLTLFSVLVNIPVFVILSLLTFCPQHMTFASSPVATAGLDLAFAWFVAGSHFGGALSWVVNSQYFLYQITGAALYLDILFVLSIKRRRCTREENRQN